MTTAQPLPTASEVVRETASQRPNHPAFIQGDEILTYAELDVWMDRVACALQRDGVQPKEVIGISAVNSIRYVIAYLGAVRAGICVAPLPTSTTPESISKMMADAGVRSVFVDESGSALIASAGMPSVPVIGFQNGLPGAVYFDDWLGSSRNPPEPVAPEPDWPFNIIYSSGTTGTPKGIVQPFGMRAIHLMGGSATLSGYGANSITLLSTPLYSNTTLVSLFPTLGNGGTVLLMDKFDVRKYLELAERYKVTHTMLVPVQYQRLMSFPEFGKFDLSSFQTKQCTSAPFSAELKADILARWPGKLIESYGMTEGGGVCILEAHSHPDKLHTVGKPAPGHDIRMIDAEGREVPRGEAGEIVGFSGAAMLGYHGLPEKTREIEWISPEGKRFLRTGDVGRFDEDGFVALMDRKKDIIISGGFNIYPSDLEEVLREHPAVADASVVGVQSARWGETPVGYVVLKSGSTASGDEILQWANGKLGKMQRLAAIILTESLPRNGIGKVLKRELRERFESSAQGARHLQV
ncbi:class I adenylate-forming enzyme family protein [Ottowia caeni]|uniref:class I adenylate-forming enzyme family protein n=1 Tax=Ottowia caeni TaxID=2870339 RepID=UPI001E2EA4AC|nr:acyl--CoA ligase [Ottowia caeni]